MLFWFILIGFSSFLSYFWFPVDVLFIDLNHWINNWCFDVAEFGQRVQLVVDDASFDARTGAFHDQSDGHCQSQGGGTRPHGPVLLQTSTTTGFEQLTTHSTTLFCTSVVQSPLAWKTNQQPMYLNGNNGNDAFANGQTQVPGTK